MSKEKVVVIGGSGFYGRYLVADLIRFTTAQILVASRHPVNDWNLPERVQTAVCDIRDLAGLERLMENCAVVIHCAGPFHSASLNPLRAAINTGTHYVDIAEVRSYLQEVKRLEGPIRAANISVLSGLSVVPALEALVAELFRPCFDTLASIRTFAAPDTRKHRGEAMFQTMLAGVGQPFWQPGEGKPRLVYGWTEPEWVEFPPPLGKRLTYLVLEMADLDLLPELFGAQTVEFKAGVEWTFLNRLLGLAAQVRKVTGYPHWETLSPLVRFFSWLVGRLGKDEGGVIFELGGLCNNASVTHRLAVVARRDGGLIPSVLASLATAHLLTGHLLMKGIVPVHQWIQPTVLLAELQSRGLEIWWQSPDRPNWRRFDFSEFESYQREQ